MQPGWNNNDSKSSLNQWGLWTPANNNHMYHRPSYSIENLFKHVETQKYVKKKINFFSDLNFFFNHRDLAARTYRNSFKANILHNFFTSQPQ